MPWCSAKSPVTEDHAFYDSIYSRCQNKPVYYRDGKWLRAPGRGESGKRGSSDGWWVRTSFGVTMFRNGLWQRSHNSEYTISHQIVHVKWNYVVCSLHFSAAVFKNKPERPMRFR